jgi:hypothetical protein
MVTRNCQFAYVHPNKGLHCDKEHGGAGLDTVQAFSGSHPIPAELFRSLFSITLIFAVHRPVSIFFFFPTAEAVGYGNIDFLIPFGFSGAFYAKPRLRAEALRSGITILFPMAAP